MPGSSSSLPLQPVLPALSAWRRIRTAAAVLGRLFTGMLAAALLVAPAASQTVNVGVASGTQTATVTFANSGTLGTIYVLTTGQPNLDYTFAGGGTCTTGATYAAAATCTVNYVFTPRAPGQRLGAVQLVAGDNVTVLGTALLSGTGTGPAAVFPGNTSTVTLGSGFSNPGGIAVDAAGNVYVADTDHSAVKEIVAVGGAIPTSNPTIRTLGSGFSYPFGVAVDGAGNVYVADSGHNAVKELVAVGGAIPASNPTIVALGSGFSGPDGVAVDGAGNVYVADTNHSAVKEIVAVGGAIPTSNPTIRTLGSAFFYPYSVAVDGAGNVYVADTFNNAVNEVVAVGGAIPASNPTIRTLGSGFYKPIGVAVDGAGNVYVADTFNNAVKEVVAVGGAIPASNPTIVALGSGFSGPSGVAVDGAGNVYVADHQNNAVKQIPLATPPTVSFAGAPVGTTSADSPRTLQVQNAGNADLHFAIPAAGNNPALSSRNYVLSNSSTCPQVTSSSPAQGTLAAGGFCTAVLSFSPVVPSSANAALAFLDDSGSGTQTAVLSGTATAATGTTAQTISFAQPASPAQSGTQITLAASASSGLPVLFSVVSGPATLGGANGNVLTFTGTGAVVVEADQYGNSTYAAATAVQRTVTVQNSVGVASGTQTATVTFATGGTLGTIYVLTTGQPNLDYTFANGGTCATGATYAAGATCTVNYVFTPRAPGQRLGAVQLVAGDNVTVLGTTLLSGTGTGPAAVFPGNTSTVALGSGFNTPYGVAVDGAGNVYVADTDNSAVKEIVAVGGAIPSSNPTIRTLGSGFSGPSGVAVDGAGNVYVADAGNDAVKEMVAVGGAIPTSNPTIRTLGSGFFKPIGVAVDGAGNVYVADTNHSAVKEIVSVGGAIPSSNPTIRTLGSGFSTPQSVAVDGAGNVYVADTNHSAVKEIVAVGGAIPTSNPTIRTLGSAFFYPYSVAVDGAGNVYVADTFNRAVKELVAVGGAIPANNPKIRTLGSGFSGPSGVAVDGAGNVYVANLDSSPVKEIPLATPPSLQFGPATVGGTSADSPKSVTVQNAGNGDLLFPAPAMGSNPSVAANFSLAAGAGTCPQVAAGGTAGTLAAGSQCNEVVSFTPTVEADSFSGSVQLLDNSLGKVDGSGNGNAIQSIAVTGGRSSLGTPVLTGISPNSGPQGGGTTVTITGSSFLGATSVTFGGTAATSFTVNSDTQITAVTPFHAGGRVAVAVANSRYSGSASLFTYVVPAAFGANLSAYVVGKNSPSTLTVNVSNLAANGGTGDVKNLTVNGTLPAGLTATSFTNPAGTIPNSISFSNGTFSATYSVLALGASSQLQLTGIQSTATGSYSIATGANSDDGNSGIVTVTLTVEDPPAVTGITPAATTAGTYVTLTGANFGGTTAVYFGGTAATEFSALDSGRISVRVPSLAPGTYNVTVTTPAGTSTTSSASQITVNVTPTLTVPNVKASAGGTTTLSAVVSGTAGSPQGAVSFVVNGGTPIASTCVASGSSETCTANYSTAGLLPGVYSLTANFAGDSVYAAASNSGTLLLTNASQAPATAVGTTSAPQTATVSFTAGGTLKTINVLTQGVSGLDYAYVAGGTCTVGQVYTVGQSCTVEYSFTPGAPGLRLGSIVLLDDSATPVVLGNTPLGGVGQGALALFQASTEATSISQNLSTGRGLTVDVSGNIYLSNTNIGTIVEYVGGTGQVKILAASVPSPSGTAVDGAGNVFYGSSDGIYELAGGTGTPRLVNSTVTRSDNNLSVDSGGNLYTPDSSTGAIYELPASDYSTTLTLVGGGAGHRFIGMAVDASGNLFAADFNGNALYEVAAGSGALTQLFSGNPLSSPHALALDAAGDVYVANLNGSNIYRFQAGNYGAVPVTLSLAAQHSLAVGPDGSIYAIYANSALYRYSRGTLPPLGFPATNAGASSSPQTVTLENDGTTPLTVSSVAAGTSKFAASSPSSSAAGATLPISVTFTPPAKGPYTDTVTVASDAVNGALTFGVTGTATGTPGTVGIAVASPSIAYGQASTTLSASVSYNGIKPTNLPVFQVGSGSSVTATCSGSASPLTCTASYATGSLAAGTHTITVSLAGDENNNPATPSTGTLTVNKAIPALAWALPAAITYGTPLSATQLNATATYNGNAVAGTFTYTPPAGTVLNGGADQTLSATFAPADTANYGTPSAPVTTTITVSKTAPAITFVVGNHTYSDAPFAVNASSSSTGAFTYAVVSGPATISGSTVTLTGAGTVVLSASQAEDANYTAGTQTASFTVAKAAAGITFAVANHTYGDGSFLVSASSLSTGAFTYAVVSGPATISGSTVTLTGAGTVVLSASQAEDANYTAGTQTASFTVRQGTAQVTLGGLNAMYDGSAHSSTATTSPAGLNVTLTYNGSTSAPTAAGNYAVVATVNDANYTGSATGTLVIAKAAAPIAFMVSNHTYGDAPFLVSASSSSTGAFTYTVVSGPATISGSMVTLMGAGTVTLQASQAADGNYKEAAQSATFNVAPGTAPITFAVANHTFGDAPFTVSATSQSTGAFTYAVVSGPATVSGSTVTLTGAGTVTLQASQAADANDKAATQTASFTVAAGTAPIAFAVPNHTYGDAPFAVSASSSSTGTFTYTVLSGPATISSSTVTLTGAGTVTLSASQAADANYKANSTTASFTVSIGTAPITFAVPNHTYGEAPFVVSASSASTGGFTYSVVSGPATVRGNVVSLTGVGTVVLSASQAADANYAAGTQTASFTVVQGTATVVLGSLSATYNGNAHAATVTTSPAGLNVMLTYNGSASAPTAAGSYTVVATVADANYTGSSTGTLVIAPAAAAITFAVANHTYGDAPFAVSASSSSTGAFTYTVVSGPATLRGNVVSLTGAGAVTLSASQAADANYAAGAQTASFTVAPTGSAITFAVPNHTYGDAPFTVSASSNSTGAFTYTVVSGPAALRGNVVSLTGAGAVTLSASQAADANYTTSSQTASFAVAPAATVLTFPPPAPIVYGTALGSTQLNASATAAGIGAVSGNFTYTPTAGTVPNSGTVTLQAQFTPSDPANFTAPAAATTALTVTQAPTTTVVTTSASPVLERVPVTFTATVKTTAGGTVPVGAVTFSDGGTPLGTATLNASGVATYTAMAGFTGSGNRMITAAYTGNANQAASSATVVEAVGSASTLQLTDAGQSSYAITVQRGLAAQTTVTLTLGATFAGTVNFSCSGLPANVSCTFTPSSVTLAQGSGAQSITLLIRSASLQTAVLRAPEGEERTGSGLALAFALPGLLVAGLGARSRRLRESQRLLLALFCLAGLTAMAGLSGCGSGSPPLYTITNAAAGTYNFSVVATSGSNTATLPVTLTIQ